MNQLPTIEKPAPKTKKPMAEPEPVLQMPSETEQIISDMAWECRRDHEIADKMLAEIVTAKRNPSFAEQTFFKGRCGWSDREQQLQVNRMSSILRYKDIAGSAAERSAASAEQVRSHEILATEGTKLDAQIAKLSEQKDSLERNATRATRVVEQIGIAVESLRNVDVLRADLQAKHEGLRRQFAESDWSRLCEVGVEVSFRKQMLSTPEDPRKFVEALGIHFSDCRKYNPSTQRFEIDSEPWEARTKVMRIELMELQDEFDRLTALKSKQLASLEPILNFYLEEK